jgi:uncharacterized protein YyaL (SSP411 family)
LPTAEEIAALPPDGGEGFNRLVFEHSPYLLQHARNPVDWFPWGDEAFAKAAAEGKPVLLSVGYTTCHWCHVMEHESFEDEEVAKMVNDWFVPVKVDREERPDIDEVYMTVTQAMTGSGGWPMTVVMTADKKPFFAGTYFPKDDRPGRPGFKTVLNRLHEMWVADRERVVSVAENIDTELQSMMVGAPGEALGEKDLARAADELKARFDKVHAGFGSAPKFPTPPVLSFLLRAHARTGDPVLLEMVEKTLRAMRLGGVYDQFGFGTHRYSTDAEWLVPHFEKMLYDQALLAIACTEAYQATGKDEFASTAREIFTYVLRDMTSPEGGFYSAEDADSEGEEGVFYVWTPEEVASVLGEEDGTLVNQLYGIVAGGNWTDEATGEKPGTNIPHLSKPLAESAAEMGIPPGALAARVEAARAKLFAHRDRRPHPQKDDKVLTDWNGLMIAALAKAGQALGEPAYTAAAERAAGFILRELKGPDGRLLKRWRNGAAGLTAHLEDYAFLAWGLIDLYEATFNVDYLREALALNDAMLEHFWDEAGGGGFFMTADDSEQLLVRAKKSYGGAIPSGNAVAALNLLRLSRLTGNTGYEDRYAELLRAFSGDITRSPSAFPQFLIAIDFAAGPSKEIVVAGKAGGDDVARMLAAIRRPFLPNKVVVFRPDTDAGATPPVSELAPYTREQKSLDGKATAYVCENFTCQLPTTDVRKVMTMLGIVGD